VSGEILAALGAGYCGPGRDAAAKRCSSTDDGSLGRVLDVKFRLVLECQMARPQRDRRRFCDAKRLSRGTGRRPGSHRLGIIPVFIRQPGAFGQRLILTSTVAPVNRSVKP
jgi:hypothetical protein